MNKKLRIIMHANRHRASSALMTLRSFLFIVYPSITFVK